MIVIEVDFAEIDEVGYEAIVDLLVMVVFTVIDVFLTEEVFWATMTMVVVGCALNDTDATFEVLLVASVVDVLLVVEGGGVTELLDGVGATEVGLLTETTMSAGALDEGASDVEAGEENEAEVGIIGAGADDPSANNVTELSGAHPGMTVAGD